MQTAMKVDHRTPNGVDKVSRYGWQVIDKPGELIWLDKNELHIPEDEYQRAETSSKKVLDIAAKFSWIAFGALIVVRRGGRFFVLEGGHRLRAVLKRSDIGSVPCVVFDSPGLVDEANLYITTNTQRKPMDGVDRHKAYMVANDPVAKMIDHLASISGREVARIADKNTIRCVGDMRKILERDPESLYEIWGVITEVCEGHALHQRVLSGLHYIHKNSTHKLTDPRVRKRVIAVGYDGLLDAAAQGAAFYQRGGASSWAAGMLNAINKGLRNRIEMQSDKPD